MNLLLISNSTSYGKKYLEHVQQDIINFFNYKKVLFVPYALKDHDKYAEVVQQRFKEMGIQLSSIHLSNSPTEALQKAEGLFVGGGNTFRLLDTLYKKSLLSIIKDKVVSGTPYMGSSAGVNITCPTIKTTNDMPIIYPSSFNALGLIPFQINPHYQDPNPNSKHMGETREQRIKEYQEENDYPVLGLRENTWLLISKSNIELKGPSPAKLFIKGKEPFDTNKNEDFKLLIRGD